MHENESSSLTVYTALNIKNVITNPSLRTVQFSPDGQLLFMVKNAVYIFTPEHGIHFEAPIIKSSLGKDGPTLGWFRTMIQIDKSATIRWPDYSLDWSATSLGSLDISLVSVEASPSGLSPGHGCIVATLTSNMDLDLWTAEKHYLKGEWTKVFQVTPYLLDLLGTTVAGSDELSRVLQAQITSMQWTTQADFGMSPKPWIDGSLLVVGSRSGHITFLRYVPGGPPEYLCSLSVSDQWITELTFNSWTTSASGTCEGSLAYGGADGSVGLVNIVQRLVEDDDQASFVPRYVISLEVKLEKDLVCQPASTGVTALKWIPVHGKGAMLVITSPGFITIHSRHPSPPSPSHWTGNRTLRLKTQKMSRDSSCFHPATGISYIEKSDTLVITLFDGSFHVITNLSTNPKLEYLEERHEDASVTPARLTSLSVSKQARMVFNQVAGNGKEKTSVGARWNDMMRISGATLYDDVEVFIWAHEADRPSDFSYKQDAQHTSVLTVAQLCQEDTDLDMVDRLGILLQNTKAGLGMTPLYLLRPYLLHLRDPSRMSNLLDRLLEILRFRPDVTMSSMDVAVENVHVWTGNDDEELRFKFRVALRTHLYGSDELTRLRMKLSLADFAWKTVSGNEAAQIECGMVAQQLVVEITHLLLGIWIKFLRVVVAHMTLDDLAICARIISQSTLGGTPEGLERQARDLLAAIVQHHPSSSSSASSTPSSTLSVPLELCPACTLPIPISTSASAINSAARCPRGHSWPRCSISGFILSTSELRTCVGCARKAFLEPVVVDVDGVAGGDGDREVMETDSDGQTAYDPLLVPECIRKGWVVKEMLGAVTKCLFCGNGFVKIL